MEMLDGLRSQFEQNSSYQTRIEAENKITLENGVIFDDGRTHFVFSDKTALVLHPKGDCFTYYAKNGQKTRQLVSFAVNSAARESTAGSLDKLLIALQFYNTYCDEPIFSRPELIAEEQLVCRLFKQEHASWPGVDNLGEYIS